MDWYLIKADKLDLNEQLHNITLSLLSIHSHITGSLIYII